MEYIISRLTETLAKKLLSNKSNALAYLSELNKIEPHSDLTKIKSSVSTSEVWKLVVKHWDYERGKKYYS